MRTATALGPGFAAFTSPEPEQTSALGAATAARFQDSVVTRVGPRTCLVTWGGLQRPGPPHASVMLTLGPRTRTEDLTISSASRMTDGAAAPGGLHNVLPPFALCSWDVDEELVRVATDWLGFRQVYETSASHWCGVSSSAAVLAAARGSGLDASTLATQCFLGWQTTGPTLFEGIAKISAGTSLTLGRGQMTTATAPPSAVLGDPMDPDRAASRSAAIVREGVVGLLQDHPDVVLQLTGGLDSRVLLAAIPPSMRRGVRAMTLAVPGSLDVALAQRLAAREGLEHQVVTISGLEDLDPAAAYDLCIRSAVRLESSADPVAFGCLSWAESGIAQGPRISGLGGEVTRGFYYFGPGGNRPVSARAVRRLARWRLFGNESVAMGSLDATFRAWAKDAAVERLSRSFTGMGERWDPATDEFYLWHRMQRWAGVLATASCFDRCVVNPMLDWEFIEISRRLPPSAKRNQRHLSRILMALEPSLAELPLDGRPAPRVYAQPGARNASRIRAVQARRVGRKLNQRLRHEDRPPAGGEILAAKVVEYWRTEPDRLAAVRQAGIFSESWLDQLAEGVEEATPATVAMMLNCAAADQWLQGQDAHV